MNLKSGYPYSLIRNGLVTEYPKLTQHTHADIVILGGGISGALAAWHLVEKGLSCIVVDARSIGLGSTCASTSLLQYEIDIPLSRLSALVGEQRATRAYLLCLDSIGKLVNLAKRIGFEGIQEKQSLYLAAREKDMPELRKEFLARKKAGIAVRLLERADLLSRTGIAAPGALLSAVAAQTDAYLYTHALHHDAMKKGLRVYDRTSISSIEHKPRSVAMLTDTGHRITARKLVYATGYEVVELIDKPIVKLHSTFATASEPLTAKRPFWKNEMLIWNTANPYLYARATPEGRVIVGGRDVPWISPARRNRMIPSKTRQLANDINTLLPGLDFIPEFSWTGTYGVTRDGLPFIGKYSKLPNSYFALGFGGNGITFSLVAAEILADLLTGKKNRDTSLFSFDRIP